MKTIIELIKVVIAICSIFILFSTTNCKAQAQQDKELIRSFVDEVINRDSMDFKKFYSYVPIHRTLKKSEDFKKFMNYIIAVNKELNQMEPGKYDIITYNEIDKYPSLKESKSYKKLEYNRKENVYFATKSDASENVYIFIIKEGKIVSFFPYIGIGAGPLRPFMLNKRANKEYLKTITEYIGL